MELGGQAGAKPQSFVNHADYQICVLEITLCMVVRDETRDYG